MQPLTSSVWAKKAFTVGQSSRVQELMVTSTAFAESADEIITVNICCAAVFLLVAQ